MSKKYMPLWREAHFQVKMCKAHHSRTTFGSWHVEKVHTVVARSSFPRCLKLTVLYHFLTFRCRSAWQGQGIRYLAKSKRNVRVLSSFNYNHHHTTLQLQLQLQLEYLELYYIAVHYTNYTNYITLHSTPLHYTQFHSTQLHDTQVHYAQLHNTQWHYNQLHYTTLHDTTRLHNTTRHYSYNYNYTTID